MGGAGEGRVGSKTLAACNGDSSPQGPSGRREYRRNVLAPPGRAVREGGTPSERCYSRGLRCESTAIRVAYDPVSPIGSSNERMGSSPAPLVSWPGDGDRTSGAPKPSKTCGPAAGILTGS